MAVTLLSSTAFQTPSGGGTGSSNANGGSAIDATGASLLTLCIGGGYQRSPAPVITDNFGNTWTALTAVDPTGSVAGYAQIFYAQNPTVGTGLVVTITCQPLCYLTGILQAWSGAATSSVFDVQNGGSLTTQAAVQPGSVTPSQNNSLIITSWSAADRSGGAAIDSGFSTPLGFYINAIGNAYGGFGAYLVQTTLGAVNPTWANGTGGSGDGFNVAVIAVFKPATGGSITGTSSWTENSDTWSASGAVAVSGAAAWTEAQDTWAASGSVIVSGSAAWTDAGDAWAASGSVATGTTGVAAWTEAQDTWAGTGAVLVSGSAAWTEVKDIWAGAGTITLPGLTGSVAWTEAQDTWSGAGSNGTFAMGGHFIPLTRKQEQALRKRARADRKRQEDEWEDKLSDANALADEIRSQLLPSKTIQDVIAEAEDDPEEDEDLEMILLSI